MSKHTETHPPFTPTQRRRGKPRRGTTKVITVSIPPEERELWLEMARQHDTSVSRMVRAAVEYVRQNAPEYVGVE